MRKIMLRKIMLRYLTWALIMLAAPLLFLMLLIFLPVQYENTFLGELKYKTDLLEETAGKRIIVIGGSGVAFGQDSRLMEEQLPDYSVVNFGMYAALGSTVMLELAKDALREGDIVIFSPEQNEQTLSMYFGSEAMWQAADGRFSLLHKLSYSELSQMVGTLPYFTAEKFRFFSQKLTIEPKGLYRKAAFNVYGDIQSAGREQNIMTQGFDSNMPVSYDSNQISEEFVSFLNDFSAYCEQHKAFFYYRFCPVNQAAVTDDGSITAYAETLGKMFDFKIMGDPQSSIMEAGWFYDTNFHLNASGMLINTAALVDDIKNELGDTAPTAIALPEMPAMLQTDTVLITEGKSRDEDCFIYESAKDNKSFIITGLSSAGTQEEELQVPVLHNELPVTGFTKDTFSNQQTIEDIYIQSNITTIPDEAFLGCTALAGLHLEQESPESCTVAEGLLTGTECKIYVPNEQLGNYMTNYFWSIFSDRILAEQTAEQCEETGENKNTNETENSDLVQEDIIVYHGNGGTARESKEESIALPMGTGHIRTNTALGSRLFEREGYTAVCWNTAADGSGQQVGFGSRIEKMNNLELYMQWEKEAEVGELSYTLTDSKITITKYKGNEKICAIPEEIDGYSVTQIGAGAFAQSSVTTVILPPTIFRIEQNAFEDSCLEEIYLYDSLYYVYDESFEGCDRLTTLHINAATCPVYSGSYFDAFADKVDWLSSISEQKKIVLFSGSSGRYGYDSISIMEAFLEYQVANMGVYAYTNALPQLMLIKAYMQEGDILISAPEFDTIHNQFCESNALDSKFFAMMESNYDMAAILDLSMYDHVFDSLSAYLTSRSAMPQKSYDICAAEYDDDGNHYDTPTYNVYGDFILNRPNGTQDVLLKTYQAEYTCDSFPQKTIDSINAVYGRFLDEKITVYFTYAPRNRSSLTASSTLAERRKLQAYLEENLIVPVISDIEDSLFSGIYCYLIDNHLSTEGVEMRTEQFIKDLQAAAGF